MLHYVLSKYEFCFDGTLVTQKTKHVDIEIQSDYKPLCAKPHPVLKQHKYILGSKNIVFANYSYLK